MIKSLKCPKPCFYSQVPYLLDYSLLPMDRLVIAKAMYIIQSISCVRQVLPTVMNNLETELKLYFLLQVCPLQREQALPLAQHL